MLNHDGITSCAWYLAALSPDGKRGGERVRVVSVTGGRAASTLGLGFHVSLRQFCQAF